jgi:hypothetical protein
MVIVLNMQVSCSDQMSSLSIYTHQQLDDEQRQYNWERGQIDYLGADSFENILSRLNSKLNDASSPASTSQE